MPDYFEFEVSLRDVEPRIWRRFLLKAKRSTFWTLHQAIQEACGWQDYHLFEFRQPGSGLRKLPIAGLPTGEDLEVYEREVPHAKEVQLSAYFGDDKFLECVYLYDFGDHWIHDVRLVASPSLEESFRRRLVGGARSFPPEDCGGTGGYERCRRAVEEGKDPEEEDVIELWQWLGKWDPERFELEVAKGTFDR